MPNFVKLIIRVVFFEESLKELRFAEMKLIEWVILTLFVELSMNIKAIRRPVPKVNNRRFGYKRG